MASYSGIVAFVINSFKERRVYPPSVVGTVFSERMCYVHACYMMWTYRWCRQIWTPYSTVHIWRYVTTTSANRSAENDFTEWLQSRHWLKLWHRFV